MGDRIGLAQAISVLRVELTEALNQGTGKLIQFALGPIDLEFQVEVGREGSADAKIRFWIVEAGAGGKVTSTSTQTVKIRIDPIDAVTGKQMLVADTDDDGQAASRRGRGGQTSAVD